MKKSLLTFLLLSAAASVWPFDYYESNILGMKLSPAGESPPEDCEYVLRVEQVQDGSVETLLSGGKVVLTRTTETIGGESFETTEKDGKTEKVIRRGGLVVSEETAEEGKPAQLFSYNYEGGRLVSADIFSDGELSYTEKYLYTKDGRLLDVRRVYADSGDGVFSSFIFKDGRINAFWSKDEKGSGLMKFGAGGLLFSEISSESGWSERREYGEDDAGRRTEKITDEEGRCLTLTYDEAGKILFSSSADPDGMVTEQLRYEWDGELLSELTVKKELSVDKFSYEYDEEGLLTEESHRRNGTMVSRIFYRENRRIERLFRFGTPILEITYEDDERIGTKQLQD